MSRTLASVAIQAVNAAVKPDAVKPQSDSTSGYKKIATCV